MVSKDKQSYYKSKLNFLLFLIVAFFTLVIFFAYFTILPHYVLVLGGSEFQSGLQSTLFFMLAVALRFYFGPLADEKGIRLTLLLSIIVFATASLFFLWSANIWSLLAARLYQAIGVAAFFPSGSSLVAAIAPADRTGTYIGTYRLSMSAAIMVGPFLAEAIIASRGYSAFFLSSFYLGAVALLLAFFVKTPPANNLAKANYISKIMDICKDRGLWPPYQGIALSALSFGILLTFTSLFIARTTQVSNHGIYYTIFSLSGLVVNLGAGHLSDRLGRPAVLYPSLMILGLGMSILYFLPGRPAIIIISGLIAGAGYAGSMSVGAAWIVDSVDTKTKTTALAMQENVIDLSVGLGSFIFGAITAWVGMGSSFFLSGAFILAGGAYFWKKHQHKYQL